MDYEEHLKAQLKNPEFKKEYDNQYVKSSTER
jgi:hypothetical protein